MKNMQPFVTINRKTGRFFFNRKAAEVLGIYAFFYINISPANSKETVWKVQEVIPEGDGLCLHAVDGDETKGLEFSAKKLANRILCSVGFEDNSARVLVERKMGRHSSQWVLRTDLLID